jgi:hypothetical protein
MLVALVDGCQDLADAGQSRHGRDHVFSVCENHRVNALNAYRQAACNAFRGVEMHRLTVVLHNDEYARH